MKRVSASAGSDVGRVRRANEDAYFVGESVYAVADGMGGHLAGEVASATALEPISSLDGRVFPDATAAVAALRNSVVDANRRVAHKAARDPNYRGMGTTLTAALVEGRRIHVAHVGDSRAYLLRHGEFGQLTVDHTLVQHLLDEGHISVEEAEAHPQRSVITRAIGVSDDVDVDSMTLDLVEGDSLLLCSDGLTGVVPDASIAATVARISDPDEAVAALVDLANEAGGPDNITVLLLRYGEVPELREGDTAEFQTAARARSRDPVVVNTRQEGGGGDWAKRLGTLGSLGTDRDLSPFPDDSGRHPGRWQRVVAILLALSVLAALAIGGGWWLLSRSYYVGLAGDEVVIYRGVEARVGPVELSWVEEPTDLTLADVPAFYRDDLREGVLATDLADARRIVANAPRVDDATEPSPDDTATPSP